MSSENTMPVLVVDDDAIIRKIHSMILRKFGLETFSAKNGKEAVDLYRGGASFQLVLMDNEMPVMDGPTATRELRAMGIDSTIVGITTRDEDPQKSIFMEAGLNDFRSKPLTVETLGLLLQKIKVIH